MNSFVKGFEKTAAGAAAAKGWGETLKRGLVGAKQMGGGFMKGLKASGDVALKEHLSPGTALKHIQDATKGTLKTQRGRQQIGEALGKAAPSVAATGAYAYGAKKLYDKTLGNSDQKSYAPGGYY